MLVAVPLVLVGLASAAALTRWPVRWAQALIWILVLQNVVVILAWKVTGSNSFATDLLYAKEVVIAGGGLVAVLLALRAVRERRLPAVLWIALAFGVLCAVWVPISYVKHESIEQIARGLRSLVYPVLLLAIGALAVTGLRAGFALRTTLWWTSIVLGASAIFERTLVPLKFWISIGLEQYWINVRGESAAMLNGGLPWNFYVPLLGSVVRRAFGIMTDPLDLSYFLILPLALAVAEMWRAHLAGERLPRLPAAAAVLSAAGIAFSLSRLPILIGGGLIVLGPLVALGLSRRWWRRALAWAVVSGAAFSVVLLLSVVSSPRVNAGDIPANAPLDTGSEGSHVVSLLRISEIRPLIIGRGLGTAGYLSAKFAASGAQIGYEDPYLDAAGQVGALGALLLAGLLAATIVMLLRVRGEAMVLTLPAGAALLMLGVGGILAGQLEVITSLGPTWLFAGVMLSLCVPRTAEVERPAPAIGSERRVPADAPTPARR